MELMHNAAFRILDGVGASLTIKPGIYRVILDEPELGVTVAALIKSEDGASTDPSPKEAKARTGRKKTGKAKRKRKPLAPLVGDPLWLDRKELEQLDDSRHLQMLTIEREAAVRTLELTPRGQQLYADRKSAMAPFLDFWELRRRLLRHRNLGPLVRCVVSTAGVSRGYVYRQWSNLCRHGFDEASLIPRHDRSGAPGVSRPCDPGVRKKAGRKTTAQRVAAAFGVTIESGQPGMTTEWAAAIHAADKQIPNPKPPWRERCTKIIQSHFVSKAKEENGTITFVDPPPGSYPNRRQIRRLLTTELSLLQRILDKTTKAHFSRALRGLVGRDWEGVAGPGHTWAIDSTVGDIYLRSSINRAWIIGRPIVYVIVDVWSTAVVGFYVCLTGPSWNTAKVSLFNAAADPALIGDLWGYQAVPCLEPAPTLCFALQCDRGEYLSLGHRTTAFKLLPLTSYTPPYRADLKGLVEVLHRIEKDAQFLFVPGAMDYRRKELELRKVNPADCVLTVREYVHYLQELFFRYNLTADRTHRVDAHMQAAGVFPSPAGLWRFGHEVGIGLRRFVEQADLISNFLPSAKGHVRRDAVWHAGNDFMSPEVREEQWTTIARNRGGWDSPVNFYPGSFSRIWTPPSGSTGLLELRLSDQSRASSELTFDEWLDVEALRVMKAPGVEHARTVLALESLRRMTGIVDNAKRLTADAIARAAGAAPTMTDARVMEVAAGAGSSASETQTREQLRDEATEAHLAMMESLLATAPVGGGADAAR
jgi:putative transposase